MSFELIQVEHISGGQIKATCLACGESEFIFPNPRPSSGVLMSSSIQVTHTCRVRRDQ